MHSNVQTPKKVSQRKKSLELPTDVNVENVKHKGEINTSLS